MSGTSTTDSEIDARLAFLELGAEDQARLRALARLIDARMEMALSDFYEKVARTPAIRHHFQEESRMKAAKSRQAAHWRHITKAEFNAEYISAVRRIGAIHADIGLEPRWYIGGYATVLDRLVRMLIDSRRTLTAGSRANLGRDVSVVMRAALLDIDLSISCYLEKLDEARKQAEDAQHRVFDSIAAALARLSEGDLGVRVDQALSDQTRFNETMGTLSDIISSVRRATQAISTGSGEIAAASDDLARRTEQQAASLEQTAASLDQLTTAVHESATRAKEAEQMATRARQVAEKGSKIMDETRSAMNEVSKGASEMGQIIGVINEIAFQTNLLALNAGVEAARAGEAERGFAVVAAAVRALAQRSAEAVRTIQTLIDRSGEQTAEGVKLVTATHSVLGEIVESFNEINTTVIEMATSAQSQALSISEINTAVRYLDVMTQQNAAMVEQTNATTNSLNSEAKDLIGLVQRFTGI